MNALSEVSQIKVAVPNMAQQVIDMALQLHGGGGMSDDFPLASAWIGARSLRLADGPDEVHRGMVARLELGKYEVHPATFLGSPASLLVEQRRGGPDPGRGAGGSCRASRRPGRRRDWVAALTAAYRAAGRRGAGDGCSADGADAPPRRHLRRRLGGRAGLRRASTGAGSTSWSTTPASPAAAGSTSPGSTSGSGSPRSTCSAWSAAAARSPRSSSDRARGGSSTSPRSPGWCTRPGWRRTTR